MTANNKEIKISGHLLKRLNYYKESPGDTVEHVIRELILNQRRKPKVEGIDKRIKWSESTGFKNVALPLSITETLEDLKKDDGESYASVIDRVIKYYTRRKKT